MTTSDSDRWRSAAVQSRARAQKAADAHEHDAIVVNPADG